MQRFERPLWTSQNEFKLLLLLISGDAANDTVTISERSERTASVRVGAANALSDAPGISTNYV